MGHNIFSDSASGKATDLQIGHFAHQSEATSILQHQATELRFSSPSLAAPFSRREALSGSSMTIPPVSELTAPPMAQVETDRAQRSQTDFAPAAPAAGFDKNVSIEDLAKTGAITDLTKTVTAQNREQLEPGEAPKIKVQFADVDGQSKTPPDFVVSKDGTVQMMNNPEKSGQKEIVIEVQRDNGQLNPTEAQQKTVDDLYSYLDGRIKQQFPDTGKEGVRLDDAQDLISRQLERQSHARMPQANPELPGGAQDQEARMGRHQGGGHGTMSRHEANENFPERSVPRQPNENNQIAAMKDVVAGFVSRGDRHPYEHIENRGPRGWGIGRYGQTFDQISSWLSNVDIEALEKLEQEGKVPKGTAARMAKMKSSVEKAHQSGKDSDLDPFLQKLKAGDKNNPLTASEVNANFGKEVQELSGSYNIGRFAEQMGRESGKVDPGQLALAMTLGRVPTEQDMSNPENKRFGTAATQAYQIAENRQTPGDRVAFTDSSTLSGAMHDAVGKQLWRGYDSATQNGNLGCAITVTRILRAGGVPVKEELSVDGAKHEMERIGAQKVSLNQAIASGEKYVIIKQQGGSHTGIGQGRTVVENSSARRRTVQHDISESSLKSGSIAYIIPTRDGTNG